MDSFVQIAYVVAFFATFISAGYFGFLFCEWALTRCILPIYFGKPAQIQPNALLITLFSILLYGCAVVYFQYTLSMSLVYGHDNIGIATFSLFQFFDSVVLNTGMLSNLTLHFTIAPFGVGLGFAIGFIFAIPRMSKTFKAIAILFGLVALANMITIVFSIELIPVPIINSVALLAIVYAANLVLISVGMRGLDNRFVEGRKPSNWSRISKIIRYAVVFMYFYPILIEIFNSSADASHMKYYVVFFGVIFALLPIYTIVLLVKSPQRRDISTEHLPQHVAEEAQTT